MKTKLSISLLYCLLASGLAKAQNSNAIKEYKRKQWEIDLMHTGIGFELTTPSFGNKIHHQKPWTGINILLGPFVGGYSQGISQAEFVANEFISEESELTAPLPSRSWYIGTNLPIPLLTFGEFRSYKNVFRGHPYVQSTFGGTRFGAKSPGFSDNHSAMNFTVTPGYRIRFPYGSVDLGVSGRLSFGRAGNSKSASTFAVNPNVVLRLDGLFDSFNAIFESVDATKVDITNAGSTSSSSTQYNADGSRTITTRTTTYYQVKTEPTKMGIADIGRYAGFGFRVSRSNIGTSEYSNMGTLIGVNALIRNNYYVLGLNIEGGRIGHASEMRGTDPSDNKTQRRIPNKQLNHTSGSTLAFNTLLDVGLDLNSLLLSVLGGIIMDDHSATSFLSFNAGYSLGYSVITGQRFDNPDIAIGRLDGLREPNRYNDARLNSSGYLGGWFLACDVGNVSFKTQWYRYRRAPLSNGMMMSVAYRFARGSKH